MWKVCEKKIFPLNLTSLWDLVYMSSKELNIRVWSVKKRLRLEIMISESSQCRWGREPCVWVGFVWEKGWREKNQQFLKSLSFKKAEGEEPERETKSWRLEVWRRFSYVWVSKVLKYLANPWLLCVFSTLFHNEMLATERNSNARSLQYLFL